MNDNRKKGSSDEKYKELLSNDSFLKRLEEPTKKGWSSRKKVEGGNAEVTLLSELKDVFLKFQEDSVERARAIKQMIKTAIESTASLYKRSTSKFKSVKKPKPSLNKSVEEKGNGDKLKNEELNDPLLNKLNEQPIIKTKTRIINAIKSTKIITYIVVLGISLSIFNSDKVEDVWRWIKLTVEDNLTQGDTLSKRPIKTLSDSFLDYTKSLGDINTENTVPLTFTSVTRFKANDTKFKAVFYVSATQNRKLNKNCTIEVDGILSKPSGGISDNNYSIVLSCKGKDDHAMKGYKLIAFPPDANVMLSPVVYSLLNTKLSADGATKELGPVEN